MSGIKEVIAMEQLEAQFKQEWEQRMIDKMTDVIEEINKRNGIEYVEKQILIMWATEANKYGVESANKLLKILNK